jgi:uncharacterized protein (DUF1499 family)
MSFNKYYIPEPLDFAKHVVQKGPTAAVTRKIDAIIGNATSSKIFKFIYDMVLEQKPDELILEELRSKFPDQFNGI